MNKPNIDEMWNPNTKELVARAGLDIHDILSTYLTFRIRTIEGQEPIVSPPINGRFTTVIAHDENILYVYLTTTRIPVGRSHGTMDNLEYDDRTGEWGATISVPSSGSDRELPCKVEVLRKWVKN